jgi:hypothetical protein
MVILTWDLQQKVGSFAPPSSQVSLVQTYHRPLLFSIPRDSSSMVTNVLFTQYSASRIRMSQLDYFFTGAKLYMTEKRALNVRHSIHL